MRKRYHRHLEAYACWPAILALGLLIRGPLEIQTLNLFLPVWFFIFLCLIWRRRGGITKSAIGIPTELKWLACLVFCGLVWCCLIVAGAVDGDAFRAVAFGGGWALIAVTIMLPQLTNVSPAGARRMLNSFLLFSGVLAGAQIIFVIITGYGTLAYFVKESLLKWDKNNTANIFLFGLAMCLGRMMVLGWKTKTVLLALTFAVAQLLSRNRGGVVGILVALAALPLVGSFGRFKWVKIRHAAAIQVMFAVFVGLVVLSVGLPDHIGRVVRHVAGRQSEKDRLYSAGRFTYAETALLMVKHHWIVGVGPGQYDRYYFGYVGQAHNPFKYRKRAMYGAVRSAHNIYLRVWTEFGIVGLLTFLGFILSCAYRLLKASQKTMDPEITGILLFWICFCAHGAFTDGLIQPWHYVVVGAGLFLASSCEASWRKVQYCRRAPACSLSCAISWKQANRSTRTPNL